MSLSWGGALQRGPGGPWPSQNFGWVGHNAFGPTNNWPVCSLILHCGQLILRKISKIGAPRYNNNIICYTCEKPGHRKSQCPLNKTTHKTAAMVHMNNDDYSENYSTRPHECDEVQAEGQIKLACGCMLPVVVGALSRNGENKLKQWKLQMTPCSEGEVNGIKTMVLRDTGSTTCVVKTALVKPEQMTGTYELCMLIDGVIKLSLIHI